MIKRIKIKISLFLLLFLGLSCSNAQIEHNSTQKDTNMTKGLELATFGGGCFWCTEAIFLQIEGVESVKSGYSDGHLENPTYEDICTGSSGHAEVVQISFDPKKVSYIELLEVFFATHDPTTLNRQGADKGTQYRSTILAHNVNQLHDAQNVIRKLKEANVYQDKIVTVVKNIDVFYPAEDYHQNYYNNNTNQGYCRAVITPKVEKFKKVFVELLKKP